ncbi:MAG: hypothetical protein Q8920_11550 [Bacillota bacterium]|nr:hypothetical protein [Bacillota bacterium]
MSFGQRVKYLNTYAIVLRCEEKEVLLFIDAGYIKWVDKAILELKRTA